MLTEKQVEEALYMAKQYLEAAKEKLKNYNWDDSVMKHYLKSQVEYHLGRVRAFEQVLEVKYDMSKVLRND